MVGERLNRWKANDREFQQKSQLGKSNLGREEVRGSLLLAFLVIFLPFLLSYGWKVGRAS